MGAGMGVPGVGEAGGIFHQPYGDAGLGVFEEALGEQRLAQLGNEAVLPGHGGSIEYLKFWIGHYETRCWPAPDASPSRVGRTDFGFYSLAGVVSAPSL